MRNSEVLKKLKPIRIAMNYLLLGGEIQMQMDSFPYFGISMTDEGRIVYSLDPPEWTEYERTFHPLPWKASELTFRLLALDSEKLMIQLYNLTLSKIRDIEDGQT